MNIERTDKGKSQFFGEENKNKQTNKKLRKLIASA